MDGTTENVAIVFLVLVSVLCLWGAFSDVRSGSSRMAHEDVQYSRGALPLNFWLAAGSKFSASVAALVLIIFLSL